MHLSKPLEIFQGNYHENQFNVLFDSKTPSKFYIHNPETLIEVSEIENEDKAEVFYIEKRFTEAFEMSKKSINYR